VDMAKAVCATCLSRLLRQGDLLVLLELWQRWKFICAEAVNFEEGRAGADAPDVFLIHFQVYFVAAKFPRNAESFFTGSVEAPASLPGPPHTGNSHIKIRRREFQTVALGANHDVGENWQCGAGTNHVLDGLEAV